MTAIRRDDVPVAIQDDNVELRMSEVGRDDRLVHPTHGGYRLGPALTGLPDDLCPCPHWGYMLGGRLAMRTKRGEDVYEGGQAFYWSPGHAPVALTDCEYVDFSPTAEFAPVIQHISGQ